MTAWIEKSKSGRSSCQGCNQSIEKGIFRYATLEAPKGQWGKNSNARFMSTRYWHTTCVKNPNPKPEFRGEFTKEQQLAVLKDLNLHSRVDIAFETGTTAKPMPPVVLPSEAQSTELLTKRGLPKEYISKLMPFQKQGVAFTLNVKGKAMICDEMGLGKTVQGISVLVANRNLWPALIIAPSSVKLNWADELERWVPGITPMDINVVPGRSAPGDLTKPITIATYATFCNGSTSADMITKTKFKVVVLDESHYIKNGAAARTKMLLPIVSGAKCAVLLSGTPALARPIELWTQVHSLRPDIFPNYHAFTKRYCDPKRMPWGLDLNGSSNTDELHRRITQFMIRRLKKDVLKQLPPKRRQLVRLDISPADMKPVISIREKMNNVDIAALASASHHGAENEQSGKSSRNEQRVLLNELYSETGRVKVRPAVEYIRYMLESVSKLIVFAHHIDVMDALEQHLQDQNVQLIRIDGSVNPADRHQRVQQFQEEGSEVQVALLGLTSAGQGITLTAASHVVFVEMHWTPGILAQAEDRAHRIGQVSCVNVTYLFAKGSLDDIVWPMVQRKLDTVGKVLDGANRVQLEARNGQYDALREQVVMDGILNFTTTRPVEASSSHTTAPAPVSHMTKPNHVPQNSKPTDPPAHKSKPTTGKSHTSKASGLLTAWLSHGAKPESVSCKKRTASPPIDRGQKEIKLIKTNGDEDNMIDLTNEVSRTPPKQIPVNDDEIEEDSDDADTYPSPFKFHFCVSDTTGRIFLFDSKERKLNINFLPDELSIEALQLTKLLPSHLDAQACIQEIRLFVRQWRILDSKDRARLQGLIVSLPLRHYLA